jgi:hypothetical protein
VARLGYTLTSVDNQNGLVSFETGMSMRSWAGQRMSAHVLDIGDGQVQITIGGAMKVHGAQLQVYDWVEAPRIAVKVFEDLDQLLGPGEAEEGHLPAPGNSNVRDAVIWGCLILVVGSIALVLLLVVYLLFLGATGLV